MGPNKRVSIGLFAALALVCTGLADGGLPGIRTRTTVDHLSTPGDLAPIPLNHQQLVGGTERVQLLGQTLAAGDDYWIDTDAGLLYLKKKPDPGSSLVVTYSYLVKPLETANILSGQRVGVGGGLRFVTAFDSVGDQKSGSQIATRMLGWNSSSGFGGLALKGLALFSSAETERNQSRPWEYAGYGGTSGPGSSSRAIAQQLDIGKVSFNYQNIDKGFRGLQSNAGLDPKQAQQLTREQGLVRRGIAVNGMQLGSLRLNQDQHTVADGKGQIDWRSYGFNLNGFSASWSQRKADKTFTRFGDLAETNRAQLESEKGLTRSEYAGGFDGKADKLSFSNLNVSDAAQNGVRRQSLESHGLHNLKLGYQSVDKTFDRVSTLGDAEKGQWAKEAGVTRRWLTGDTPLGSAKVSFDQQILTFNNKAASDKDKDGSFAVKDWGVSHKAFDYQHAFRYAGTGFSPLGSLTTEELNQTVAKFSKFYGPETKNPDRASFVSLPGIKRTADRLSLTPSSGWSVVASRLKIEGEKDKAFSQEFGLQSKSTSVNYKRQAVGSDFGELTKLMDFEKAKFGPLVGLDRTDFGFGLKSKDKQFDLSALRASTAGGDVSRTVLGYKAAGLELGYSKRKVDEGFADIAKMQDTEQQWLNQLKGYSEEESKVSWQAGKRLKVEGYDSHALSLDGKQKTQDARDYKVTLGLTSSTTVESSQVRRMVGDATGLQLGKIQQKDTVIQDLGHAGKLSLYTETVNATGAQQKEVGSIKKGLKHDLQLTKATKLVSERSTTVFDNGEKETVTAETVSQALTKRFGIAMTSLRIERENSLKPDQSTNQFGAWWDVGGGVKVDYGAKREGVDRKSEVVNNTLSVSQGTVEGTQVGGTYNTTKWDDTRTQSTSKVSVATQKPFRAGPLFNLKIKAALDTAADKGSYQKQDRDFVLDGQLGSTVFQYLYKSQQDPATLAKAQDRGGLLGTDPNGKGPFKATFAYKWRALPNGDSYMIRNFNMAYKVTNRIDLGHQLITNPEVSRADLILGSQAQQTRVNRWKLDYKNSGDAKISGSFDENINGKLLSRVGGITFTANEAKGSPISFFLGAEAWDNSKVRRTSSRYYMKFEPKASDVSEFALFLGNVTYHRSLFGSNDGGLTIRLDYTTKF